jgi:hypothetical protein
MGTQWLKLHGGSGGIAGGVGLGGGGGGGKSLHRSPQSFESIPSGQMDVSASTRP